MFGHWRCIVLPPLENDSPFFEQLVFPFYLLTLLPKLGHLQLENSAFYLMAEGSWYLSDKEGQRVWRPQKFWIFIKKNIILMLITKPYLTQNANNVQKSNSNSI